MTDLVEPPCSSVLASGALVSIALVCVIALHVLRDDLEPTGHRLSEYANGPYGTLMTIAFFSVGAGLVTFAWALYRARQRQQWSRLVIVAVIAAGVGMVVAGVYRTEPNGVATISELIHSRASALATLALIIAAITWSVVGQRRGSRPGRPDAPAVLALAAGVLGALSPLLHRSGWTGLSQRALWSTLLAWLLVSTWRLSHEATPSGPISDGTPTL